MEKLSINSKEDFKKLISGLTKTFVEKSLKVEFDQHIGYEKWDQDSRYIIDNYRKGTTSKVLKLIMDNLKLIFLEIAKESLNLD